MPLKTTARLRWLRAVPIGRCIPPPLHIFHIGVRECNETLASEARLVAGMNDPCRQFPQSQHGAHVIGDIRVVQIVDERTVVNGVA